MNIPTLTPVRATLALICTVLLSGCSSPGWMGPMPTVVGDPDQVLDYSFNDNLIACRWGDGSITTYDFTTQKQLSKIAPNANDYCDTLFLVGSDNPRLVATSVNLPKSALIYDPHSGMLLSSWNDNDVIRADEIFGCDDDGQNLYSFNDADQVVAININTLLVKPLLLSADKLKQAKPGVMAVFSPLETIDVDRKKYTRKVARKSNMLKIYDAPTGKLISEFKIQK